MIRERKKLLKIICILVIICISMFFVNNIYATEEIMQGAKNFIEAAESNKVILDIDYVKVTSDSIFNIFIAIGTAAVVITGAILGLQFMLGSVEEKAKIQEALIPYIIGSIVIFGAFGIWKAIALLLSGLNN